MLVLPDGDPVYRICSIDPGSNTLGLAVLEVDLLVGGVTLVEARTFNGERMSQQFPHLIEVHGEKVARLYAHEQNLLQVFSHYQPHAIICESPFLGRFPQAYAALVECLTAIRRACYRFNPHIPLETIDPITVKQSVGVVIRKAAKGEKRKKSGLTKEDIKHAVLQLPDLTNASDRRLIELDEHSIDATAVGYYKYRQLMDAFSSK